MPTTWTLTDATITVAADATLLTLQFTLHGPPEEVADDGVNEDALKQQVRRAWQRIAHLVQGELHEIVRLKRREMAMAAARIDAKAAAADQPSAAPPDSHQL